MPPKHCCATHNVFMELTVTKLSNIHDMHCYFTCAILVMPMHHDVVCTLSCSHFYTHSHLGIIISYLLTHTTMMSSLHITGKLNV